MDVAPEDSSGVHTHASQSDPVVVELYKLAVEMADRVSARRTSANNFFVALHATLAAVIGFLGVDAFTTKTPNPSFIPTLVTGTAGVLLCAAWWLGLRSYRDLNRAKFKVITGLEDRLPVQVFAEEWKYLRSDEIQKWRGRYAEQGAVERIVPFIFGGLYVFAVVSALTR